MKKLKIALMVMAISSNLVCSSQQEKSTGKDAAFERLTEAYFRCLEEAYEINQDAHNCYAKGLNKLSSQYFKFESEKNKKCEDILKYLEEIKKLK